MTPTELSFQNSLTLNQQPQSGKSHGLSSSSQTYQQQLQQYLSQPLTQQQYTAALASAAANPLLSQTDLLKALTMDLPSQVNVPLFSCDEVRMDINIDQVVEDV